MNVSKLNRRHAVYLAAVALAAVALLIYVWDAVEHRSRITVSATVVRTIQSNETQELAVLQYDAGGFEGLIVVDDPLFRDVPLGVGETLDLYVDEANPAFALTHATRREVLFSAALLVGLALVLIALERFGAGTQHGSSAARQKAPLRGS